MDEPVYTEALVTAGLVTCSLCGGAVSGSATSLHNAWHSSLLKALRK